MLVLSKFKWDELIAWEDMSLKQIIKRLSYTKPFFFFFVGLFESVQLFSVFYLHVVSAKGNEVALYFKVRVTLHILTNSDNTIITSNYVILNQILTVALHVVDSFV